MKSGDIVKVTDTVNHWLAKDSLAQLMEYLGENTWAMWGYGGYHRVSMRQELTEDQFELVCERCDCETHVRDTQES